MSKISIENTGDGGAIMYGPFGPIRVDTFECDVCSKDFSYNVRHIVWHQPWHGEYWGDILWACPDCAESVGAVHHSAGDPNEGIVEGVNAANKENQGRDSVSPVDRGLR